MKLAKTKKRKWVPSHDIRIENAINKYTNADIISLLREQCEITVDIWKVCFSKHLSDKFEDNYHLFEKRRNQIAHNKPIDYELYKSIKKLCENIYDELINGHTKFCSEFISDEEKERIDEYRYELEQQENLKYESLREIAEDESGTRVRNDGEIVELFDQTMYELYKSLIEIFNERQDIEFDEYHRIQNGSDEGKCFVVKSKIREMEISIMYDMDINCSQGETSCIDVVYSIGNINEISEIDYINGEYIYNYEQTNYMPEVQDRIVNQTVVEAKERICSFIEKEFPNLREEADLQNHLKAMGKSNSIVQSDVTCFACEEEYICINKKYAPVGTCLNCGEKNRIRYCTYCKCPVTAISIKEDDDEGLYCEKCHHELFTSDK
jgi:hypothetical protein